MWVAFKRVSTTIFIPDQQGKSMIFVEINYLKQHSSLLSVPIRVYFPKYY